MQNTMLDSTISNSLQLFQNPAFKVRVIMRCAEPWFVAKDVADCIEHSDTSAMCKLCRDKDKVIVKVSDDSSETQQMFSSSTPTITCISESGLYRILAKCNLPKCEPFESWVFDEVLPSIRKRCNQLKTSKKKSSCRTEARKSTPRTGTTWTHGSDTVSTKKI